MRDPSDPIRFFKHGLRLRLGLRLGLGLGLLGLWGCLVSSVMQAQDDLPDPDAEGLTVAQRFVALMERIEHRQAGLETLEASFRQRQESPLLLEPEESRGTVAFRTPDCVRWDFESPTATTVIVCDRKMLTWYRDQRRAERRDVGDSAERILNLLGPGASLDTLRGYFDITAAFPEDETEPYRLDLDPRSRRIERRIRSLTLALDRRLFVPIRVRIEEANDGVTELWFDDLVINGEIPAERFHPDLPDDVEVLDPGSPEGAFG